ncbi:MAG: TetR family transcriptional regulator [Alphaproteobacteria bacterium]|jgi:TetR/AcrR family transcriptional regulator|nr:TetR family transcriptional regulator [Alphaproteobacteria bacterium]MBT4019819.1 TetR family transcriptional regulator [Alphaproteobacteria bacterium]MBT4966186.1 TetR family transcriptional regulator [Alphaproteobacteria bacterium]MBT5158621.1 TetR family transcriptional regulator [Alphaproteobacteria bacterium]MBT5917639.1 TetR family transcriptional regulator [Alphaproteobacteria bacterium]
MASISDSEPRPDDSAQIQHEVGNRANKRRLNETQILQAAESAFAERGYGGTTTAAIAKAANLPKANVHYYFGTKKALYQAVLDNILSLWLEPMRDIQEDDDPAAALTKYVQSKMRYTRERPSASKVFANELLHGAAQLEDHLKTDLKELVDDKAGVLNTWIKQGRIKPVDPVHLFFLIWASTQTYADFDVQISAVLGKPAIDDADFKAAEDTVIQMVLSTCGLLSTDVNSG